MTQPPILTIRNLSVVFPDSNGGLRALEDLSFEVYPREFVCVLGPSGSGKTTLLRILAGLIKPTAGSFLFGHGEQPSTGMVFQQANLMPWLCIADNIRLLLDLVEKRAGAGARAGASVQELIEVVGLQGFEAKYPHQLSGGMQQRAALARALALDPAVLLMDEPFAALDEITRDRMAFELMRIWNHYRKTVLFVTHSLAEAVFLSDRVVLMSARPGRIHRVFEIDLPRPRDRETRLSEQFHRIVGEVNRELYRVMS